MNSLDYSQTNNIQNIIDEIEERTNLTVPSAVLIPLKQHRTVNLSANDTFEIDVELVTRKKIFKKISIQPAEIENPNLVYKFGTKGVSRLSENEWDICKKIYHKLSENIDEECVYGFVGAFDNKYIFGDNIISPTSTNTIKNVFFRSPCTIEHASANFFFEKYLPCFKSQTEGLIFLFTLLLSTCISRLGNLGTDRPSFILAVIGRTGSYKTSTVQATLNPYNNENFSVCSFEDTVASIIATLKQSRDMITIVDDFYTNTDREITAKLEKIIRLNGDKSSVAKKMSGKKIVSESSDTITVVTGEQIPKVRFSSIPRMLIIDFQEAVNLQALTELQASQAEFRGALADFIQYTLDIDFCIKLRQTFLDHRDSIMHHEAPKWHARYTSMCCWFLAIYDMFCEYCTAKNIFFASISDFPSNIRHYIAEQSKRYLENDSIFIFFKTLESLRIENKLHTINTSKITNDTPKTDILYSDDYVWIESVNVFAKIKLACQNEGISFDLSRQELYQKLESEKLLITKDNRRSYEYRKGQFRQSVICLPRNNLNRYLTYDKEDIKL